jgi:DNA-binding transcriptional LysR family regulator
MALLSGPLSLRPSLPLPDLSIRQLEYLVAVDDEPTWAQAADSVGVSASALSQGLAELERRLGVSLFDRDGRRRHLRPSAQPVLTHARQVLGLTGDLARWADRQRTGATGTIRLGMIDAAAVLHFPDTLREFRLASPDVDILLRVAPSAQLLHWLVGGELDLVVCVEPPAGRASDASPFELTPLLVEELAVYGPPGTTSNDPASWGPWVLYPMGSHTRALIVDQLRARGASLEVVAESHQPDVLREMVRFGTGWTVLSRSQAELGERPLDPGPTLLTRQLVVATRRGTMPDPAVDILRDRLVAAAM